MSQRVRRCPQCGFPNPAAAEFCEADGFPLFGVEPTPAASRSPASSPEGEVAPAPEGGSPANEATQRFDASAAAWLESAGNPDAAISIWDGAVVGRGDEPDVDLWPAASSRRISRRHAVFFQRDGRWYVESAPSITNYTAVNGERLEEGEQAGLAEGDHIAFADAVFLFHEQTRRAT